MESADPSHQQYCSHCWNVLDSESMKTIHEHCEMESLPLCRRAVKEFKEVYAGENGEEHVLFMAVNVEYIYGQNVETKQMKNQKRYQRSFKLNELSNNVSALRNSGGGYLLVELVGKNKDDKYIGYFDEFVDKRLYEMIEDGKLFDDTFTKIIMSEHDDCKEFSNFVVLSVTKGFPWSTSDFRTKIALDDSIAQPLPSTMMALVNCGNDEKKPIQKPQFRFKGIFKDIENLHERRDLQLKGFVLDRHAWLALTPEKMAKKIWDDLRLKEYITAFSKNTNGGSYLFGFSEELNFRYGYKSKILKVNSVPVNDIEGLESCLKNIIKEETLMRTYDGEKLSAEDIVEIKSTLHSASDKTYVIEIAVRRVEGIVFYDKLGPVSYKILNSEATRVNVEEWFQKMKYAKVIQKSE